MILPMVKYSFIVFHKDYEHFLEKLGKLGVLDIIEQEDVNREEELSEDHKEISRIDAALELLQQTGERTAAKKGNRKEKKSRKAAKTVAEIPEDNFDHDTILEYLHETEKLAGEKKELDERLEQTEREIERLEPWGDFNSDDLEKLKPAGYAVRLFKCAASRYKTEWEEQYNLFSIGESEGIRFFLVIEKASAVIDIDADHVDPGKTPLSELHALQKDLAAQNDALLTNLDKLREKALPALEYFRRHLDDKVAFREAIMDTRRISDDQLMILEGWVPDNAISRLEHFLEKEDVVSLANLPEEGEIPPVELKNSRFSRLFEPISKLFDLPNYGELDLTPYFAPFFMIFFGFALGDAGYGFFFILFAAILKLRVKKTYKPILSLAQVFGVATIVFGLLSGTFFGVNLIDSGYTITDQSIVQYSNTSIPPQAVDKLKTFEGQYFKSREEFVEVTGKLLGPELLDRYETSLIRYAEAGLPMISSFRHLMQDPLQMFYLAILIGGVQILFAMFVRVLNETRRRGFKYAVPTIGWLILIIAVILKAVGLFEAPYLDYLFYSLLAISGVFILLLNRPGSGLLTRIGSGIWDSYGMVTGFFGDLLSYIRLFALGISSAILGFVFNDISMELLNIPYIGWLLFLVLLVFGHTINLFMATLGGFIHPMRLTFVEFYKNAGFEGGGRKYTPFTIRN